MKLVKQKRLLPGLGGGRVVVVRVIVLFYLLPGGPTILGFKA